MSMKYLGETFDLHCGGVDLVFPHHENEIAQSQCGTGVTFARHWMHVEHLLVEGETMSKSKGNFFTIPDLVARGHRPDAIRYLLASAHYRKQLNFTFEGLDHARAALERIHGLVQRLSEVDREGPVGEAEAACAQAREVFAAALFDDLNTPEALAAVHNLVTRANALLGRRRPDPRGGGARPGGARSPWTPCSACSFPRATTRCPRKSRRSSTPGRRRASAGTSPPPTPRVGSSRPSGVVLEDTPKGTRFKRKK